MTSGRMLPYSKRSAQPEILQSGDFEVVNEPLAIPRVAKSPVFARSASPASQPFGPPSAPASYDARLMGSPPPPNSLSPVAMSAQVRRLPAGKGGAAETVVIRSRPTLRWGMTILFAGALIGGALGVFMKVRQNESIQALEPSAETAVGAPLRPEARDLSPTGLGVPASVAQPPPQAVVLPTQPPVLIQPTIPTPAPKETKEPTGKLAHAGGKDHGSHVAAPKPAPKPPSKPAVVVATKVPAKPAPERPKGGASEAEKILQEAMKNTSNTL